MNRKCSKKICTQQLLEELLELELSATDRIQQETGIFESN